MGMRYVAALLLFLIGAPPAVADTAVGADFRTIGQARLTHLLFDVYDATLSAPQGRYDPAGAFALTLTYHLDLRGRAIVDRSLEEMRQQQRWSEAQLRRWGEALTPIIPNVKDGDRLTGIADANGTARFYHNGRPVGTIADADFTKAFFDIWLGPRTSRPDLRKALLGHSGAAAP